MNWYSTPIKYDNEEINFFVPKEATYKYLQLSKIKTIENIQAALDHAIQEPLDSFSLQELIEQIYEPSKPIVIVIDDHSRPNIHTRLLLPLLENKLTAFGVKKQDIHLFIATGTHSPPELPIVQQRILKSLYDTWKDQILIHDCDDMEHHITLGTSSLGTPITIDKRILDACLRINLSDSEYHYFAGVAGTVKQFVPGCAARKTVRINHSRIFDLNHGFKPDCKMGTIEGNICIQDIREMVQIIQNHYPIFTIDAIMDKGSIVNIFAGNPVALHTNAKNQLQPLRDVPIEQKADVVIVAKPSVNLYQAGKGYDAASHAVKKGGTIILLADCENGIGPMDFFDSVKKVKNKPYLEAMRHTIKTKCSAESFEIGIQNTVELFKILDLTNGKLYLYSQLTKMVLEEIFRVKTLDTTLDPQLALRQFLTRYIIKHPDHLIYVFEDFNMLTTMTK